MRIHFGDGSSSKKSAPIDTANANLLREAMAYRIWGPRPIQAPRGISSIFSCLKKVFVVCSEAGILARNLMRYPKVQKQFIDRISPSVFGQTITEFHRLLDARDKLTFVIAGEKMLKKMASEQPAYISSQAIYIPPRIWQYQLHRLRECIDDYNSHKEKIEECFIFCLNAYAHNYGSIEAALARGDNKQTHRHPFGEFSRKLSSGPFNDLGERNGCRFYGPFEDTAKQFGILDIINRWAVTPNLDKLDLQTFSIYLNTVEAASSLYIANFTLQRCDEVHRLHTDCLYFENDSALGRIAIIRGETTKTDPDSDARWVVSPNVETAIGAASSIACLRMRCAKADTRVNPSAEDISNPYLFSRAYEPWATSKITPYSIRPAPRSYKDIISRYPKLFDIEQIKISAEDLRIAQMITPTIKSDALSIGMPWPFAWHQLRRTGAVNMFASGLLSDSTIQFQLKHLTKLMPLYYGRGHTKLALNKEAEEIAISTMYEMMALHVLAAFGERFVSPHGPNRKNEIVVNLVSGRDANQLATAGKKGEVPVRETVLGMCTSRTVCTYGGHESIARCSGGDGFKPCTDVLYDIERKPQFIRQIEQITIEMSVLPEDSPRYKALSVDKNGLESVINVLERKTTDSREALQTGI